MRELDPSLDKAKKNRPVHFLELKNIAFRNTYGLHRFQSGKLLQRNPWPLLVAAKATL